MDRIEAIASVCHEANRAYCATLGDNSQPSWVDAPEWQKQSAINGVKFHLTAHGEGRTPSPSASHDSWLAEKRADGWKYGPDKNPDTKEHPCFIPYEGLPTSQKLKDYIFGAIVKAYYEAQFTETV
jgi:RyR domain